MQEINFNSNYVVIFERNHKFFTVCKLEREREKELKEKGRKDFLFSASDCYIVNKGIVIISSIPHICFSLEYGH